MTEEELDAYLRKDVDLDAGGAVDLVEERLEEAGGDDDAGDGGEEQVQTSGLFLPPMQFAQVMKIGGLGEMPLLGLDMGTRKCGLAITSAERSEVHPLATLNRDEGFPAALTKQIRRVRACGLVVGYPVLMDGTLSDQCLDVLEQMHALEMETTTSRLQIPYTFWDERHTTAAAYETLKAAGIGYKKAQRRVDAFAACSILLAFLSHTEATMDAYMAGESVDML